MIYTLPELDYGYGDLSPVISEDIMTLHHTKHHQGYVDKLNAALEGVDTGDDLTVILQNLSSLPQDKQLAVRNNGGGHINHSLFWQVMGPGQGGQPGGELAAGIESRYGSFEEFTAAFNAAALGVFGSGWAWLMPDLSIVTTPNQDNPIMTGQPMPVLGLDVWEHAYYLDYKNLRDAYIRSWWDVVAWSEVEKRFASAIIS